LRHPWPGNVRELENVVERAVVLASRSSIDAADLPQDLLVNDETRQLQPVRGLASPDGSLSADAIRPLAEVERDYITAALRAVGDNRAQAARRLGIGSATLYRKLKEYAATRPHD
jgi:DNA-binding NtrC family response regulator